MRNCCSTDPRYRPLTAELTVHWKRTLNRSTRGRLYCQQLHAGNLQFTSAPRHHVVLRAVPPHDPTHTPWRGDLQGLPGWGARITAQQTNKDHGLRSARKSKKKYRPSLSLYIGTRERTLLASLGFKGGHFWRLITNSAQRGRVHDGIPSNARQRHSDSAGSASRLLPADIPSVGLCILEVGGGVIYALETMGCSTGCSSPESSPPFSPHRSPLSSPHPPPPGGDQLQPKKPLGHTREVI